MLILTFILTGCGNDPDEAVPAENVPTEPTTAAPLAPVAPGTPTTAVEPASPAIPAEQTGSVSSPPAGSETSFLTDVRVGRQGNVDRITFQFEGAVPGYEIGYATLPPRQDGSGKEVPVEGSSGLSVRFTPASGVSLTGGFRKTYDGPEKVRAADTQSLVEAVQVGDYEGALVWAVGVDRTAPYTVAQATDPSRVYIDIAH